VRTALRDDLTAALKARDRVAATALRSALAAIENAEAVPARLTGGTGDATEVERRLLTEADVRSIVEQEVRERAVAGQEYERIGRDDLAERLRAEAEVLSRAL